MSTGLRSLCMHGWTDTRQTCVHTDTANTGACTHHTLMRACAQINTGHRPRTQDRGTQTETHRHAPSRAQGPTGRRSCGASPGPCFCHGVAPRGRMLPRLTAPSPCSCPGNVSLRGAYCPAPGLLQGTEPTTWHGAYRRALAGIEGQDLQGREGVGTLGVPGLLWASVAQLRTDGTGLFHPSAPAAGSPSASPRPNGQSQPGGHGGQCPQLGAAANAGPPEWAAESR